MQRPLPDVYRAAIYYQAYLKEQILPAWLRHSVWRKLDAIVLAHCGSICSTYTGELRYRGFFGTSLTALSYACRQLPAPRQPVYRQFLPRRVR